MSKSPSLILIILLLIGSDFNHPNLLLAQSKNLQHVINSADFLVDNINIYSNPQKYLNKIIATQGRYDSRTLWENNETRFLVHGSNNGYPAIFIVELDHPLPSPKVISDNVQTLSNDVHIRVFGRFVRIDEIIEHDGSTKKLPVLEAIAIYFFSDQTFAKPVWVNRLY